VTAEARLASQREANELFAVARNEADRLRAQGEQRVPELVDVVLACVRRSGE
jgi:hypothetical protein